MNPSQMNVHQVKQSLLLLDSSWNESKNLRLMVMKRLPLSLEQIKSTEFEDLHAVKCTDPLVLKFNSRHPTQFLEVNLIT